MHRWLALAMALGLCTACSGDADAPDGEIGSSGSGGSPGSAGTPGSGGAANFAGSTGTTGGSASGGAATVAGSTGVAGTPNGAGSGNLAGSGNGGGSSGGGAGGSSGGGTVVECTNAAPPAPPAEMKETIDITWKEMTGGFAGQKGRGAQRAIQTYPSWALDHVMWSKGSLNFCIRWDSEEPVSETLRDQVADALQRGVNAWFSALNGYDCFPFASIKTNITGWATRSRATFQWSDDKLVPLFINQLSGGAPDCPDACSRNAHRDGSYQFPQCEGGFEKRFDQEVWLQEDYDAPNGWDFGQHVDRQGFTDKAVSGGLYHIWLHEFGHGIGFPDYYDWSSWAPGVTAPKCVMNAGAAATVTDWDKWMFKRTWSELKAAGRWD